MRPKTPLTATALTLATLLVLSSAAQVAAAVVCVGMDGHIDVEPFFQACCMSDAVGARGPASGLSPAGSECGDCTDVQLKAPPYRPQGDVLNQAAGDSGCVVCSLCSNRWRPARSADATATDQRWQVLVPLTAVVLLI